MRKKNGDGDVLYPTDVDAHNWFYVESKGLLLVHEARRPDGTFVQTDQIVIPWLLVRGALALHDRRKRPHAFTRTRKKVA